MKSAATAERNDLPGPDVSIIICTRNRAEHLAPTLDSLDGLEVPEPGSVELIVVDNGSTDGTSAILAARTGGRLAMRVLTVKTPGKSRALNAGIANARGRVLLWTDDDVRVRPDWIHRMAGPILRGECDATQGAIVIPPDLRARLAGTGIEHRISLLASTEDLDLANTTGLIGANTAFGRHVLERVPGFDENLGPGPTTTGYGEDTLFGYQLLAAGYTILGVPEAVVEHHFDVSRTDRAAIESMARRLGASEAYIALKWHKLRVSMPRMRSHLAKAIHLLRQAARVVTRRSSAERARARFDVLAWTAYLAHYARLKR